VKSTSHGTLVLNAVAEVLLCHATGTRYWDIPKGAAMPEEGSADAAAREAQEECGLRLDPLALHEVGRFDYRRDKDLVLHAVLVERIDTARCVCASVFRDRHGRLRPEMDGFRWAAFDEVAALCAPSMAAVLTGKLSLAGVLEGLRGRARLALRP
jgi:8-oxo-dGTP pyrophosphatase MutT (NUDIX family)